jgi:hypothetical protein
MKLSKINSMPPAAVRFYWKDEPVNLSYYPHHVTKAWRSALKDRPLADVLADVLAGWDIEDDDGKPFQPDAALARAVYVNAWRELIGQIGDVQFLLAVLGAIADDFLGEQTAATP